MKNQFQHSLFSQLESLVSESDAFFKKQFLSNGHIYWIYNYRLASYTEFMKPSALDARGVMFEVDATGVPLELKSLPFQKFFNVDENPFVMGMDFSSVDSVYVKADGSLMSTYIEDGMLKLKSKGSIHSEQCISAMNLLDGDLIQKLFELTNSGFTVNIEYVSPLHRIVLMYEKPELKVLNARSTIDGSFLDYDLLKQKFGSLMIDRIDVDDNLCFCKSIPDMTGIEGFIVYFSDGRVAKMKTKWYNRLHHTKDSITTPSKLFECVIDSVTDDLRSMFQNDPSAIGIIDEMEKAVIPKFNHMIAVVEDFHRTNKELSRKDYAILAKDTMGKFMPLVMELYIGRSVKYEEFAKKNMEMFYQQVTA